MYGIYSTSTSDDIEEVTPDAKLYCRTCSQQSKDMIGIFEEEGQERMLADKINNCLPISVLTEDWLPLQVCLRCVLWLETAQQLRTTCLSADDKLREIFTAPIEHTQDIIDLDDDHQEAEPLPEPEPEPVLDEEPSGALQYLAIELGVKDPKSLLIVEQQPQEPNRIELKMPKQKKVETAPACCGECGMEVNSQKILRNHHQKYHNRELYPCTFCYVYYDKYHLLQEHVEMIHPEYSFSRPLVPKHKKKGDDDTRRIILLRSSRNCRKCNITFEYKDEEEYKKHMRKHRLDTRAEKLKTASIPCDYCDFLLLTEKSKIFHMKMTHGQYKPYACTVCSKTFHTNKSLKDHSMLHGSERPFLCSSCGKCFASKSSLKGHMLAHEPPDICKICDNSITRVRRSQHIRWHYDKRIFQCLECGESFFEAQLLRAHVAKKHYTYIFQCEICGTCFNSQPGLLTHEGYHKDVLSRLFKCPIKTCRRQFTTTSDTAQHCQSDHTKSERFKMVRVSERKEKKRNLYCCNCDIAFRHTTLYMDHIKTHESDLGQFSGQAALVCSICKYEADSEETITSHLESHPEAFDFPCRHCKKIFVTDTQRHRHEGVVHGGKVQCTYCYCMYKGHEKLKGHINAKHTGERPFPCKFCDKAFFDRKGLKNHSTIHTGERNNECHICGKTYRLSGDLNKHYYTVHGDENDKLYKCSECNFSTNRMVDMTVHNAAEHAQLCDEDSS